MTPISVSASASSGDTPAAAPLPPLTAALPPTSAAKRPPSPSAADPATTAAFHALCTDIQRRVAAFCAQRAPAVPGVAPAVLAHTQARVTASLEIIGDALQRYSLETLALSYNGGKDCLVLLILYLAALPDFFAAPGAPAALTDTSADHGPADTSTNTTTAAPATAGAPAASAPNGHVQPPFPPSLAAVYIEAPHPFPEVDAFVAASAAAYGLRLARHAGDAGLRAAFAAYLAARPAVAAIFVGTRRTDPHGATLRALQPTDRGWPAFTRVHPMLEWHYEEIWVFLRELGIEYCELYDHGYTSLGGRLDTRPNPALRVEGGEDGTAAYRPAYELVGDEAERLGRE